MLGLSKLYRKQIPTVMVSIIAILMVAFLLFVLPETTLSQDTDNLPIQNNQTKNQQSQFDSDQWRLAGIIASTGIISAVGTGLIERYNTNKQFKKERQSEFIKDKVGLYSAFIFYVERMIENPKFGDPNTPEPPHKISETISDIDSLLKNRLYLVKPDEFSLWLKFRNRDDDLWGREDEKRKAAIDTIYELRNALTITYNKNLIIDYNSKLDSQIDPIEPEFKNPKYH
jgi:hypothetical protein